ncbi:TetR family transcriptional regulator [Streptomyces tardus]|uniref:TetR family transcriptional regulator n=1 Tax=Streptomyces tardus TaxID=2780544 RepID=UPI003556CF5C
MQGVNGAAEKLGLRERKKRATRDALAGAAVRLAAEHGAENVTVEAISEAAGVSPRTFFNYFDSHDDAFVMIDNESAARLREAVLAAPAELSALEAVRDVLAEELADIEEQQELWRLRAQVLHRSPRLLARSMGAHMWDERGLAAAIAERRGAAPPVQPAASPSIRSKDCSVSQLDQIMAMDRQLDLYSKMLAAMASTAARVALQHWCAHTERDRFQDVFRKVFDQLAAGLRNPAV